MSRIYYDYENRTYSVSENIRGFRDKVSNISRKGRDKIVGALRGGRDKMRSLISKALNKLRSLRHREEAFSSKYESEYDRLMDYDEGTREKILKDLSRYRKDPSGLEKRNLRGYMTKAGLVGAHLGTLGGVAAGKGKWKSTLIGIGAGAAAGAGAGGYLAHRENKNLRKLSSDERIQKMLDERGED